MNKQPDSKEGQNKPELYTVLPTDKKGVADVGSKKCRICDIEKPLVRFRRNGKICRKCANIRNEQNRKKWVEQNRETVNLTIKKWKEETNYKKSKSYKENKKKQRDKGIKNLSRSYVYTILYSKGFKPEHITDELIELQKIILKNKRLCRTSQN